VTPRAAAIYDDTKRPCVYGPPPRTVSRSVNESLEYLSDPATVRTGIVYEHGTATTPGREKRRTK